MIDKIDDAPFISKNIEVTQHSPTASFWPSILEFVKENSLLYQIVKTYMNLTNISFPSPVLFFAKNCSYILSMSILEFVIVTTCKI